MVFLGLEACGKECWVSRVAAVSDTGNRMTAEEFCRYTYYCRILDPVSPPSRPEVSSIRTGTHLTADGGNTGSHKTLCAPFNWYAKVRILIHRNFMVKIRPSLLSVILSLLCSFLPTFIILYGSGKVKQRNKEEARTFLVSDVDWPTTVPS